MSIFLKRKITSKNIRKSNDLLINLQVIRKLLKDRIKIWIKFFRAM